jgi:hypothetical protein
VAFPNAPVSGQGERWSLLPLQISYPVQPLGHQVRGNVCEMVPTEGPGGIRLKIHQAKKRADVDNVLNFIVKIFHLKRNARGNRSGYVSMI